MTMTFTIRKIFAIALTVIMMLATSSGSATKYSPMDEEEIKLNFTVLSDCHIEGNNFKTYSVFAKMLDQVNKNTKKNDALVFLGDNTMNGQDIESMFFFGAVNYKSCANQTIPVMGNHDVGNGQGDYDTLSSRFMGYTNAFFDHGIEKPYYYKVINNCYFVVLATEKCTVNEMYITQQQLDWLDEVLTMAEKEDANIFVFNHYPVDYIEGENKTVLSSVLKQYDKLLYFCGHTHFEMNEESFKEVDGVKSIYFPKSTEHGYEDYNTGLGAQVEVYETEILVRVRDYYDGEWLENLEYVVEID